MLISTANLPPALLDLTLSRLTLSTTPIAATRLLKWQHGARRHAHGLAAERTPLPGAFQGLTHHKSEETNRGQPRFQGALTVRGGMQQSQKPGLSPMEELERRVQSLEETINAEEAAFEPASYSEEDLMSFYEDILSVPTPEVEQNADLEAEKRIMEAKQQEDAILISQLRERLCHNEVPANEAYRHVLMKASEVAAKVENMNELSGGGGASSLVVPIGLLTPREAEALLRTATHQRDIPASVTALNVIKSFNIPYPEEAVTSVLKVCAESGTGEIADSIIANHLSDSTTEIQRHYHVQAHLRNETWKPLPDTALSLLHHYEDKNTPAPIKTYTSAITSLFSRPLSTSRAHAWDLFSHMRYAAHPEPDTLLYTLMIRACANPVSTRYPSEPERALDLWTEMTVDHKHTPTTGSYNAIILACAKSGTKTYVNEAFRLARQMLDSHRDARGYSPYQPDRDTFRALLEGTKRIGDLGRTRWILAEMVKLTNQALQHEATYGGRAETLIDADIMTHALHAYAAYKPPFVRSATPLVDASASEKATTSNGETQTTSETVEVVSAEEPSSSSLTAEQEAPQGPSFAHLPPQSREEVIKEVEFLFFSCLHGSEWAPKTTLSSDSLKTVLRDVRPTASLFGAYMSVLYKHASLERAREAFWTWHQYWADPPAGVKQGSPAEISRNYVEALERCGNARRGPEREVALEFSDELWQKWDQIEHAPAAQVNARLIERAHIARIRALAITEEIDRALAQLRRFAAEYPASAVRLPNPKHPSRSTRVSLVGSRPLVRAISAADVPDDHVPPLLTFRDIEVLHHRLIDEERPQDIKYLTWLCKSYEWALRARRDATMKQKPAQTAS